MKSLLTTALVLVLISCDTQRNNSKEIEAIVQKELDELKSDEDLKNYLLQLHEDDQGIRLERNEANFEHNSMEDKQTSMQMIEQDAVNLIRVEKLMKKFGYPDPEKVGAQAANTPLLVIHHSSDTALRRRYFQNLYQAYQEDKLNPDLFLLYLERTYYMETGERIQMDGPFQFDDKVQLLIGKLKF